jgi:hypothetical protein
MKKLFPLIMLMILLAMTVSPTVAAEPPEASELQLSSPEVTPAKDVVLSVDETVDIDVLGHRHIQKWQRVINDVIEVKNDYIRKDVDLDTNKIILYDKKWRDIELENVEIKPFDPPSGEYYWKKVVLFVDEEDLGFFEDGTSFYTFFDVDEYPLVCWEVRYTDGTTVMYDLDGNLIGHGVPAPSSYTYLFSGYDYNWWCWLVPSWCDPWKNWRNNANSWYLEWSDYSWSVFDPATSQIRDYVEWPLVEFYYAIAHGGSTECHAVRQSGNDPYYRAGAPPNNDWAYEDMDDRDPMRFAFLGHCNGMVTTTYPSFSDAFRKGLSGAGSNTCTVGYHEIDQSDEAWSSSLDWQDLMFEYMADDMIIYHAYVYATYAYPEIIGYVAYAGDIYMKVN